MKNKNNPLGIALSLFYQSITDSSIEDIEEVIFFMDKMLKKKPEWSEYPDFVFLQATIAFMRETVAHKKGQAH